MTEKEARIVLEPIEAILSKYNIKRKDICVIDLVFRIFDFKIHTCTDYSNSLIKAFNINERAEMNISISYRYIEKAYKIAYSLDFAFDNEEYKEQIINLLEGEEIELAYQISKGQKEQ